MRGFVQRTPRERRSSFARILSRRSWRRSDGPRWRACSFPRTSPSCSSSTSARSPMAERVSTYSLAACDLDAGQWGVAVQSKFLAVGSVVPWAEPQVGAVATQAYANPRYGPEGLALLRDGRPAQDVVDALVAADDGRAERQVGIVDGRGG